MVTIKLDVEETHAWNTEDSFKDNVIAEIQRQADAALTTHEILGCHGTTLRLIQPSGEARARIGG